MTRSWPFWVLILWSGLWTAGVAQESYPTRWEVNSNGYTGWLIYQVDPATGRVKGTLLGTPVEGVLVGRHLQLHLTPGGSQLYDGWIMDRRLGAKGLKSYDSHYFLAGTVSEFAQGSVDGVYPWYGLASNGSPKSGPREIKLSCDAKDNEEKRCCCFQGSHTYAFSATYVRSMDVTFDTGRGPACQSQVLIQVDHGAGWVTLHAVTAFSGKNGREQNPITVSVPVNDTVQGLRISDGCQCCVDYSSVVLHTGQ